MTQLQVLLRTRDGHDQCEARRLAPFKEVVVGCCMALRCALVRRTVFFCLRSSTAVLEGLTRASADRVQYLAEAVVIDLLHQGQQTA